MFAFLFNRSFFRDRVMLTLGFMLIGLLFVNLFIVYFNLEERNYQVPTRYSDFSTSPLERDNWQTLYALPLFSIVTTVFNIILAVKIHASRKDISLAVISGGLFILFVNVYVSLSLLSLI